MKRSRFYFALLLTLLVGPIFASSFEVYSDENNFKHVVISNDTLVMVCDDKVYFEELSPVFAACGITRHEYMPDRHSRLMTVTSFDSPALIVERNMDVTYEPQGHADSDSIVITVEFPAKISCVVSSLRMRDPDAGYIFDSRCRFVVSYDPRYDKPKPLDISIIPITGFPCTDGWQYFGIYDYNIRDIKVIPGNDIVIKLPSLTPSLINERYLYNTNLLIENDTLSVGYYKFYRNHEPADSLRKYLNPRLWPRNYSNQRIVNQHKNNDKNCYKK